MEFKIYDYNNVSTTINLDCSLEDIEYINVLVLSGDEVIDVKLKDRIISYDSSNSRLQAFFDGNYILMGKRIKEWIDYIPCDNTTFSYKRMEHFTEEREWE